MRRTSATTPNRKNNKNRDRMPQNRRNRTPQSRRQMTRNETTTRSGLPNHNLARTQLNRLNKLKTSQYERKIGRRNRKLTDRRSRRTAAHRHLTMLRPQATETVFRTISSAPTLDVSTRL